MTQVYVRWYGNVLQGELLQGEFLGMKQVRIPLDGHNPVALFTPGHVYESVEKMQEVAKEVYSYPKEFPKPEEVIHPDLPMPYPADDYMNLEQFKRDNWDHECGHLRTDKLDEFYQLWRKAIVPFGYVEAKPADDGPASPIVIPHPQPLISDISQVVPTGVPAFQSSNKHAIQKPSKKMLRSVGQQVFRDSNTISII